MIYSTEFMHRALAGLVGLKMVSLLVVVVRQKGLKLFRFV